MSLFIGIKAFGAFPRRLGKAIETPFDDGVFTGRKEMALIKLNDHFGLDLDKNGAYSRVAKGSFLRDSMEGKHAERIIVPDPLVQLLETRTPS